MKKLLTVTELADELQVPKSWVYARTRIKGAGRIPHLRCGKYCRFDFEEVLVWLHKNQDMES